MATSSKSKPSNKASKSKSKGTTSKSKTATATKAKAAPKTTETTTTATKRTRRVVNKETIIADFDRMLESFDAQLTLIRESDKKGPIGLKYFKTLTRDIKQLRGDVSKNIKVRKTINRENSKTSGFMKPVSVSKEIATFAGWPESELHSRVDVTKFICDYIKSNDLQNPTDRRQIKPDKKLRSLLKLKESEKEPLTYYSLQRHIQPHFIKN